MISRRELEQGRRALADALGTSEMAVDRIAAALAVAAETTSTIELAPAADGVDAFDGGPVFACLGSGPDTPSFGRGLATGYELLLARVADGGDDPMIAIATLIGRAGRGTSGTRGADGALTLPVGEAGDRQVHFTLNQESGRQTNGNTRITGEQGMGKSQFLLHLLAAYAVRAPDAGFLLLDYKGDLSQEAAFVRATGARVIRPEKEPVPINPFDVPAGIERKLVPSSIAALLGSVARSMGDVQRQLLRDGIGLAYEQADPSTPTSTEIAEAVKAVYAQEGRGTDSVTALLAELAELGLFATRTTAGFDAFLKGRWIIDLSGLQHLRDLVAFVLVGWLSRNVQSLPDSELLPGGVRDLRHVVAIDEAHPYVKRRCEPLLELLRVGRSKGLPIVLGSQSLSDFRSFTELEELLPNNFILRHGRAPDAKTAQGALRLPSALARQAGDAITSVPQFHALTAVEPDLQLTPVHLHGFFASKGRS